MVDNRRMRTPSGTPETAPESRGAPRVVLADDDVLLRRPRQPARPFGGDEAGLLALVRSAQPELAIIDIRGGALAGNARLALFDGKRDK